MGAIVAPVALRPESESPPLRALTRPRGTRPSLRGPGRARPRAGRLNAARPRLLPLALLLLAAAAALPAAAASRPIDSPPAAAFRDALVDLDSPRRLAAASQWGGTYTASTGEPVTIRLSDSYPQDPALPQRWANFLAGLLHGPELATVNLYLAPARQVRSICGGAALACYSGRGGSIVAPAEPSAGISAEAILTHEYGHHVAASRTNTPWPAVDYGTKRWSSYLNVCARARSGELFPGVESNDRYELNPGEGFAEAYRVLNERRAGLAETPWQIVSRLLYPDDPALTLLEQDVTRPWTGNTQSTRAASLKRRGASRNVTVATPYDGTMRITLRAVRARFALELYDSAGALVSRTSAGAGASSSVTTLVCGSRTYRARVRLLQGTGRFQLSVSKP